MTAASYWVAAVPVYFRGGTTPVVSLMPIGAFPARLVFYLGLIALMLSWLQLGRLTIADVAGTEWHAVRRIALLWAAPLTLSIPLNSRDLWAYAAQSQLVLHHLDPYHFGPSALPGMFSVEVSHRWVDTPAPYGPLWLLTGKVIAAIIGNHVGITVAALRLLAVVGLGLLAFSVPTLAQRAGGRRNVAIWLIVANPMILVLGVGGGHNDLLMIGLMTTGLAVVTGSGGIGRTLLLGTTILTAAVAIKSPAAVALAFAVPLWLSYAPAGRSWRTAPRAGWCTAVVIGLSVAVFAAITLVSGLGLGWVKQVNSSASVVSWMSAPTSAAILWDLITFRPHRAFKLDPQMADFRTVSTVISILLLIAMWLLAMRRSSPWLGRRALPDWATRPGVWTLLAMALLSVVILGPSVQAWYFGWSLAIAATISLTPRLTAVIAGLSIGFVIMIRPNGVGLQMNPAVIPILGLSVLLAHKVLSQPHHDAEADVVARAVVAD